MGAGVSAGESNDDLIDNLKEAAYIRTASIERVFRAVDRGSYFLAEPPINAYRDVAWKNGNLHISAPCIYSEVMEGLKLKPGLSFLNLGSGTGYLSTMVGLILGCNGINHGIELHQDVIDYANRKLEEFKRYSGAVDEYDFCEPKFMQGNCLCIASGGHLYDRVYCGASCPEQYLNHVKNMIKVGGILIVPLNDQLLEMKRVTEDLWLSNSLLPVSFAGLVQPREGSHDMVRLFDVEPLTLQELCRSTVRNLLRKSIEFENPVVKSLTRPIKIPKKRKPSRRDHNRRSNGTSSSLGRNVLRDSEDFFDYFYLTVTRKKNRLNSSSRRRRDAERADSTSTDSQLTTDEDNQQQQLPPQRVEAVIEHEPSSDSDESSTEDPVDSMHDVFLDILCRIGRPTPEIAGESPESTTNPPYSQSGPIRMITIEPTASSSQGEPEVMQAEASALLVDEEKKPDCAEIQESSVAKEKANRAKFDSGLGDELISECSGRVDWIETVTSSSDDEMDSKRCKRIPRCQSERSTNFKWRKIDQDTSDGEDDTAKSANRSKMYKSPYTKHMEVKIQELPLPTILKKYLQFYRDI